MRRSIFYPLRITSGGQLFCGVNVIMMFFNLLGRSLNLKLSQGAELWFSRSLERIFLRYPLKTLIGMCFQLILGSEPEYGALIKNFQFYLNNMKKITLNNIIE